MFQSPGPIAFEILNYQVHWYGILIAVAFLVGIGVSVYAAKQLYKDDKTVEHLYDLATLVLLGAVLGSRLYFVAFNLSYFLQNPVEILQIWHGGLSIHGAMIGGIIAGGFYTCLNKLSFLKYADLIVLGVILGQAIGRWGNFFNSEAFGTPTNLPWKLYIPPALRPEQFMQYEYFHPTFLYESIWNLLVFLFLFFVVKNHPKYVQGMVFFSYLILYSIGRIFIESLRVDSIYAFLGIQLAQWASIILIVVGIIGLLYVTFFRHHIDK